jgi:hypothetical protein
MTIKVEKEYEAEIERLTELAKLQGQEIRITRERDEALVEALQKIAGMDPWGVRADDLGRAARIAREALAVVPPADWGEP